MSADKFSVSEFFDATNDVVQAINRGLRGDVIEKLQRICDESRPFFPLPIEAHPAIHTLSHCMTNSGTIAQFRDALLGATYDPDRDRFVRQSVNDVCALFNQTTDRTALAAATSACVETHIRENVVYPHMHDVFKILRGFSVTLDLPALLLPIDRARYYANCVETGLSFGNKPDGITNVVGHGTPGFKLISKGDCPISAVIEEVGVYEPTSMQVWAALSSSSSVIIDIGAHVGFYALLSASVCPETPVYALEPNPEAYKRLLENRQLNGFTNLTCHSYAGAGESGTIEFTYLPSTTKHMISTVGSSTGRDWDHGTCISVTAQSVDEMDIIEISLLDSSARPLIKVDTEGKEGDVVEGALGLIESSLPDLVVESFQTDACDQINTALHGHGYRFFRIIEGSHKLVEMEKMQPAFLSSSEDFNTLVTTRSTAELETIIPAPIHIEKLA